jgi:hypothetical protein
MKTRSAVLVSAFAVVLATTGVAAAINTTRDGEPTADAQTTREYPPVNDEMLRAMNAYGAEFMPDQNTDQPPESKSRAVEAAAGGFNWLSPENVAGVSLGKATVDGQDDVRDRSVWLVYFTEVEQPEFGGQGGDPEPGEEQSTKPEEDSAEAEVPTGSMFVLVDPETFDPLYAKSY